MKTTFEPGDLVVVKPSSREEFAGIYSNQNGFSEEKYRLAKYAAAGGKLIYVGGISFVAVGFKERLIIDTSFFQLADDFDENAFKALLS